MDRVTMTERWKWTTPCATLVPWAGIEPTLSALEGGVLTIGPPRNPCFLKQTLVSLFPKPGQRRTQFPTLHLFPCAFLSHGPWAAWTPHFSKVDFTPLSCVGAFPAWNGLAKPSMWLLLISYWTGMKYWHPWSGYEVLNTSRHSLCSRISSWSPGKVRRLSMKAPFWKSWGLSWGLSRHLLRGEGF